ASPFMNERPIDIGVQIIQREFHIQRVLRDRQDPLLLPEEILYERYHFSRGEILYLKDLLAPYIRSQTRQSRALTTTQTVCIALRFLASGTFLYTVGDAEHLSKSAVCQEIHKVCLALKHFLRVFIVFPGHLRVQTIKEAFHAIAGFPNVIGALDCTQIRIKAPSGPNEPDYVNRKGFHSIKVQMICDASYLVSNVEGKWPGSVHDSRIFKESHLYRTFEQGHHDGILLGDRGYAYRNFLMTPFPDPNPGPQTRYNVALSRTRARIEMTFGHLKERFQCLKRLRIAPDRACDIIVACSVLHNITTIRKERVPEVLLQPDDDLDPVHLEQSSGRAAKDRIVAQHFQ
ncbi:putative nuclease HARBI1, partial [Erpetoichthys calabaricus]|uniref:putative nuclease HARBI1 n=1 Tax=Erpetoichthys calabaricus TaxID=27687 RepID=UPI0022340D7E